MKDRLTTGRLRLSLVSSLMLAILSARSGSAQTTTIVATVRDSIGGPVFPSRIEVVGAGISELGDSLGRVVLRRVPRGPHQLVVRGIGFFQRLVPIDARGDTLLLPPVVLRRNPVLDSLHITVPHRRP
jgi:hypothetical protein